MTRPPKITASAPRAALSSEIEDTQPVLTTGPDVQSVPVVAVAPEISVPVSTRLADFARRNAGRELAPGDVLRGRYVIKRVSGRGGTGTVFEAIDRFRVDSPHTEQRVALKVLHGQVPEQLVELRREFQHLQSLSHPNIVRAHDYDRDGDVAFFTMEYLSGLSLSRVLAERRQMPLDRPLARAIIRDVGAALAHAHARGIVHGDLNPGNIFITDDGDLRVLDFGAARDPLARPSLETAWDYAPVAAPKYASCALLEGGVPDARDDLYSLACIAYLLLAGKHPFGERTAVEARNQRVKPPRPPGLTRSEWLALRSGLTFSRERRPADVASWTESFDEKAAAPRLPVLLAMVHVSAPARSWSRVPIFVVAILLLIAGAWWASRNTDAIKDAAAQTESGASEVFTNLSSAASGWWNEVRNSWDNAAEQPPVTPASPPAPAAGTSPPTRAAQSGASQQSAQTRSATKAREPAQTAAAAAATTRRTAARSQGQSYIGSVGAGMRPHVELAVDTIDVQPTDPAARVVVQRSGGMRGDVGFSWWTEAGTAKPGQDFVAVAPHQEHIEDGKGFVSLFVPIVADSTRHRAKSFYVVISNPSADASLGKRTLTMVTIPPAQ